MDVKKGNRKKMCQNKTGRSGFYFSTTVFPQEGKERTKEKENDVRVVGRFYTSTKAKVNKKIKRQNKSRGKVGFISAQLVPPQEDKERTKRKLSENIRK